MASPKGVTVNNITVSLIVRPVGVRTATIDLRYLGQEVTLVIPISDAPKEHPLDQTEQFFRQAADAVSEWVKRRRK